MSSVDAAHLCASLATLHACSTAMSWLQSATPSTYQVTLEELYAAARPDWIAWLGARLEIRTRFDTTFAMVSLCVLHLHPLWKSLEPDDTVVADALTYAMSDKADPRSEKYASLVERLRDMRDSYCTADEIVHRQIVDCVRRTLCLHDQALNTELYANRVDIIVDDVLCILRNNAGDYTSAKDAAQDAVVATVRRTYTFQSLKTALYAYAEQAQFGADVEFSFRWHQAGAAVRTA